MNVWMIPVGQLVNTLILMIWLRIRRREKLLTFRFCMKLRWKRYTAELAYLLPSVCQFIYFGIQPRSAMSILCIFLTVIQEEILFRGILLDWLGRFGQTISMILSGVIFAAAHLMNPADGAGLSVLGYQLIYAMAAGIAFAGLALSEKSLIPCIVIHFLNNLSASDSPVLPAGYLPWFWLCVMIYLTCGIHRICFLNKLSSGRNYQ